jgi:hypothetical protein
MFEYVFCVVLILIQIIQSTNAIRIEEQRFDANLTRLSHMDQNGLARFSINATFCEAYLGQCVALSLAFGMLILCTAIGNSFVIAAVILERNLHNVANNLIVSLAVADLMVALMVSYAVLEK